MRYHMIHVIERKWCCLVEHNRLITPPMGVYLPSTPTKIAKLRDHQYYNWAISMQNHQSFRPPNFPAIR